ncbi:winged helix DNA-binding domain-containing protein [Nocardia crassostreae]|uniref:winged helix DNA-binding domain-containing protein n=1 Tax=Nocardia crassostreae TaxID=53428 RepID=UPI001C3F803F|nr:winged helix DNA-binding domain-containing protein [Nocardia crassostreae]
MAADMVALHATDPASVYLAAAARLAQPCHAEIERALYDRDRLVRMIAMRGTLFATSTASAPILLAATSRAQAATRAAGLARVLEASGLDAATTATGVVGDILALLGERGTATTREIAAEIPSLQRQFVVSVGKSYESRRSLATEVMFALAADGAVVRAERRGEWTSNQHAWALAPDLPEIPVREARATLARMWLTAFGPGTVADIKWWTGWTVTDTRQALRDIEAVEVTLDGRPGHALSFHLDPFDPPAPSALLLPALDPVPMGWREREFYLDPAHIPALFDRMGNIGPTIWWNGRIVGGWAQRPDGSLATHLLSDPGADGRRAIDIEIDRLTTYLDGRRFTPAYRTPLERELAASVPRPRASISATSSGVRRSSSAR